MRSEHTLAKEGATARPPEFLPRCQEFAEINHLASAVLAREGEMTTTFNGGCFVDTMRPITPAEFAAWRFYLTLPHYHWRAARMAFRRVCAGEARTAEAIIAFVAESGISDPQAVAEMEEVLKGLAGEAIFAAAFHRRILRQ